MSIFNLFKKSKPMAPQEDSASTIFSFDQAQMLQEILEWADLVAPAVKRGGSASDDVDFSVLRSALQEVLKTLRNPDRHIGRATRADVMDVLRREMLDQHGFDPSSIMQALRKVAARAALRTPVGDLPEQKRIGTPDRGADAELESLRQQIQTLQEVIDHLAHPEHGAVHVA